MIITNNGNKLINTIHIHNIALYEDFFHDGAIEAIEEKDDQIRFLLTSAEIADYFMLDPEIKLTPENLLKGNLIIKAPFVIKLEGKLVDKIELSFKKTELLDLEISNNSVYLGFNIINYDNSSYYTYISIDSDNIYWQSAD